MGQFDLANLIKINNPYSNVDIYYGTYTSLQSACETVPLVIRKIGLTVGIITNGIVYDYWWRSGIADEDLILKNGDTFVMGRGEKKTGVDAGKEFQMSLGYDDYLYICTETGNNETAVWKKTLLFKT